jgi:hypothetical protein
MVFAAGLNYSYLTVVAIAALPAVGLLVMFGTTGCSAL